MSFLMKPPEFDQYSVEDVLGEGGMGIVFRGHDRRTGLPVAIKVMSKSLHDPELQARFVKENEILASLNHRNIVRCHEITRSKEGLPSIVMEMLRGVDFTAFEGKPYPELLPLMIQAAMGLSYLRSRNILHRDLSSNNVLVVLENDRRLVKIVDFGVAKVLDAGASEGAELTRTGQFFGKFAFASPELLLLEPVDWRSDIYSLGVIYFRLLFARRPLKITNPMNYMEWIQAHQQPRNLDLRPPPGNPAPPDAIGVLLGRMLARRPEDRVQTYEEIIDVLDTAQRNVAAAGLEADPASLSSLPPPVNRAASSGAPSGPKTGPSSAPSPLPANAILLDATPTLDVPAKEAAAPAGDAKLEPWLLVPSNLDHRPAATPTDKADPNLFVSTQDFYEELQSLKGKRAEGRPHPMRGRDTPGPSTRTSSNAPSTRTGSQTAPPRKKKSALVPLLGAFVFLLACAGGIVWWFLLREGSRQTFESAPPPRPSASVSGVAVPEPPAKPEPPRPVVRPGIEPVRDLSAAGRRLTDDNLIGFFVLAVRSGETRQAANILLKFKQGVNVTGIRTATILQARDAAGAAEEGIEGKEIEVLSADDPTSTQAVRFTVRGDFTANDQRLAGLKRMKIQVGPATLEASRQTSIGN